jgi:hypothetical protein
MSPNVEREAAMDDMADYAQGLHGSAVLTMSTPALLAEVDDGLALRVCRRETTARDVLLMQAMSERLRSMVMRPASNREALDGMLLIEIADESEARAPALTFNAIERRHA